MKLKMRVNGSFYPSHPLVLDQMMSQVSWRDGMQGIYKAMGLLLPHAGYSYSGSTAALGYWKVCPPKIVIVAGPSHFVEFEGIALFLGKTVETPLGDILVDQQVVQEIVTNHAFCREYKPAFLREHSVEVHFPMIKKFWPETYVVPMILGNTSSEQLQLLSETLKNIIQKREGVFIASSDLSHYPSAFMASKIDHIFLNYLLENDEVAIQNQETMLLTEGVENFFCTHCGKGPVSLLMKLDKLMKSEKIVLKYCNSGEVMNSNHRAVGYASVVFSMQTL